METQEQTKNSLLSDNAVLLKKMRLLKKLSRKQAGMLFNVSFKTIEKLENGRGIIPNERLMTFAAAYGFNFSDLQIIKEGKMGERLLSSCIPTDPKLRKRRFCKKMITKECKILRELRLSANISQYKAGKLCGYNLSTIGHIENGRIQLAKNKIEHIVKVYGFNMQKFENLMMSSDLRHENISKCLNIIKKIDDSKLKAVLTLLLNFEN